MNGFKIFRTVEGFKDKHKALLQIAKNARSGE
jgi:hypothetical protein